MASCARLILLAAVFALLASVPAGAEMYRWTDEQGREHFTMDLHRVPPEHRGGAQREAELEKLRVEPEPDKINSMKTPDALAVKRALRPRYGSSTGYHGRSAPAASADAGCASWQRSKADELRRTVVRWEKQIELNQERERRLVRTDARLQAENRIEQYEIYLEQAESALEDFEDSMRRKGVPPGCYR